MRIKRILVPTDLSQASMPALKLAAEFGKAFQAELVLLFVVVPFYTSGDILSAGAVVASIVEMQNRAAGAALAREVSRLGKLGVRARSIVVEGTAGATIVERARKGSADLIIIGTHGRSGFSHAFMGSVAERVVRTAGCPVLTVRSGAKQTTRKVASKHRGPRGSVGGIRRPSTTTLV